MSGAARIRWGIIGTGTISRSIVADLQQFVPDAEIEIVQSRDPQKAAAFAEEFGVARSTGDFDAVIHDDAVDVLYIATPFALHHDMAARALRAGKHVLVEKPMALDAAQVEDLFRIAAENDVFVMEAMWMKFVPVFRALLEQIENGLIGDVRSVRASFALPFPDESGSRTDLARSPGSLLDQGIYPITLAHVILGEPRDVYARGTVRADGVDFAEHYTLEYDDGRFMQGASSFIEFTELTASVAGTAGWLTLVPPFWATDAIEVRAGGLRQIFREPGMLDFPREGNNYGPMLRGVNEAVQRGWREHPTHTAADTIAVFRTLDRIFEQIRPTTDDKGAQDD